MLWSLLKALGPVNTLHSDQEAAAAIRDPSDRWLLTAKILLIAKRLSQRYH